MRAETHLVGLMELKLWYHFQGAHFAGHINRAPPPLVFTLCSFIIGTTIKLETGLKFGTIIFDNSTHESRRHWIKQLFLSFF